MLLHTSDYVLRVEIIIILIAFIIQQNTSSNNGTKNKISVQEYNKIERTKKEQ